MKSLSLAIGLLNAFALLGCSPDPAVRPPTSNEPPVQSREGSDPIAETIGAEEDSAMKTVQGRLAPTVEAGGWILESPAGTYLLLNIREYLKEPWFKEGASVEVTGQESPDTITIFMQGMPFRVEKMNPLR